MRFLAGLALVLAAATAWPAESSRVTLTLLHVNDVYQISPVDKGKRGGLARVAAVRDRVRETSPHTLLTMGGDTLSPSVASNTFKGEQMIAAWNAAKLDMAVFGNHEFDFGPEVLKTRMAESRFPWLGANVVDKTTGRPFGGAKPGVIHEVEGVKVGFLGVITEDTRQASMPGPDVRFDDPIRVAKREAGRLRAQGAVAVVALTHLDMEADRRLAASGAVDVILGGHDHTLLQSLVGHTPIFKAGSDARTVARVDLVFDRKRRRLNQVDWEMIPVTAEVPEQAEVARVVASYEAKLSALLDRPVGATSVALDARTETNRSGETNLGNWLADVYRTSTGADVAIINGGSIRSNTTYGPGPLSKRDILSILPFENPIVKLDVSGRTLRQALEHGLSEANENRESGRFPQVSGLKLRYDPRRPPGARLVGVEVNGRALEDSSRYALAVNAYLAGGGDGYTMLRGQRFLITPENALSETAEVIEGLARASSISPATDGRIERLQ